MCSRFQSHGNVSKEMTAKKKKVFSTFHQMKKTKNKLAKYYLNIFFLEDILALDFKKNYLFDNLLL